nr:ribosome biogenesis GTPase Der [bacterium]
YKDFIPVSAEHGKNISELLDAVIKYLNADSKKNDFEGVKIALIGRPNAGKSSLFNKLSGETRSIVSEIPGTTRDAIDSIVKYNKKNYLFVDTAGLRKKNKITDKVEQYSVMRALKAIDNCDIALLMVDASKGFDEQELKIAALAIENNKGLIIIVNKWDLIEKDDKTYKKFEDKIYGRAPFLKFAPVIFISVLTGQRIYKVFDYIDDTYKNLKKRISTAELHNFLNELKSEYSMPVSKGKKANPNFMIQIKSEYPAFAVHSTHIELLGRQFVNFIVNKLREKYGFAGAPVKIIFKNKS